MIVRPPLDQTAAARLSKHVRLRDVVCLELSARCLEWPADGPGSRLSWDLSDPTAVWSQDGTELRAFFPLVVKIESLGPEKSRPSPRGVAEFRMAYTVIYESKELTAEQLLDVPHYLGVCGFLHLWPYVRAEIQCLTAKLRLPPLVLPVIVSGHAAARVTVSSSSDKKKRPSRAKSRKARKRTGT
jgi:hypothetical protein